MMLTRLITKEEAAGLRAMANGHASGSLSTYLPNQNRVGLGCADGTPFRLVVKLQPELPIHAWTDVLRYKMGLWSRVYFKRRPHCRLCGKQIEDGEKALAFVLNPDGEEDYPKWRKAFIHAGDCDV